MIRQYNTPIAFCDTETTGLDLDDDIWEFAAIRRNPDGAEEELHLFIEHDPVKAGALPERFRADLEARYRPDEALPRAVAAHVIAGFLTPVPGSAKVHLVGANPAFDAQRIELLLHDYGLEAPWHYHLLNVEDLMIGYLLRAGHDVPLPWKSDDLAAAIGIQPDEQGRHTAMGDTRWVKAIYDRIGGGGA